MIDKVNIVFNYAGKWVFSPELLYNKNLVHMWNGYDPEIICFKSICQEFTKELGFNEVKQILVVGPSGRYYIIDGDDGIRSLQFLICG